MRKYADYEYQVGAHLLRVEKYSDGWRWLVFWADGNIEAESDHGDYSALKRTAKERGMARINRGKGHVYDPDNHVCPRCAIERRSVAA